jgi:hypothetical protein
MNTTKQLRVTLDVNAYINPFPNSWSDNFIWRYWFITIFGKVKWKKQNPSIRSNLKKKNILKISTKLLNVGPSTVSRILTLNQFYFNTGYTGIHSRPTKSHPHTSITRCGPLPLDTLLIGRNTDSDHLDNSVDFKLIIYKIIQLTPS